MAKLINIIYLSPWTCLTLALDIHRFSGLLSTEDLAEVHPGQAKFLRQLQELAARKARILADKSLSPEARTRQLQNLSLPAGQSSVRLEDLAITFTYLPGSRVFGIGAVELTSGGEDREVIS